MGKHLSAIACLVIALGTAETVQAQLPFGIPVSGKPGFFKSPYAPDAGSVDARGFPSGAVVKCPYTNKEFVIPEGVPLPTPEPYPTPKPIEAVATPPKPQKKLAILNQVVLREYPAVRFRFGTTVPVAPVVYLSQRKIDWHHIDPRLITASKAGPMGTTHDIRIVLPKGDRSYHFVVIVDGKPIWIAEVVQSSPKTM
jgi:hypothetical protein